MSSLGTLADAVVLGVAVGVIAKATEPLRDKKKKKPYKETKGLGLFR
jgi:hypothetical protein